MSNDLRELWLQMERKGRGDFLVGRDGSGSYRQLISIIETCCGIFDGHGLKFGDRVLIIVKDDFTASASFLAALLDGLVPVMLSPESRLARIEAVARSTEASLLISDDAVDCGHDCPRHVLNATIGGGVQAGTIRKLFRRKAPANRVRAPQCPDHASDQLAYILFTSGTTDRPNGVQITYGNLFSHLDTLCRLFEYDAQSRIFNATPLAHTDGLVQGPLLAAWSGAALVRPGPFQISDMEPWLNFIRSGGATHLIGNPTMLTLIERLAEHRDYFDSAGFRGVISTGGILPEPVWKAFETGFGTNVWNVYGMTETVANALYAGTGAAFGAWGSIGRPVDCEARLGNSNGQPLGDTEADEGELQLRGANICAGYWRNPERTRKTHLQDGWMRTGDLVRRRADGSFDFLGRLKSVINQGGMAILPDEVDEALLRHPAVLEAVTVGLSDPEFEQIAVSAVVLNVPVSEASLTAHCRGYLEPLKMPKRIIQIETMPHTPSGKVDRQALGTCLTKRVQEPKVASVGNSGMGERIIEIASGVFHVDRTLLTYASSPESIEGWDSFTHLNLILAVEDALDIRIATPQIAAIRDIGSLVRIVEEARQ